MQRADEKGVTVKELKEIDPELTDDPGVILMDPTRARATVT